MFVMAMLGSAIAVALGINILDKTADTGLGLLQGARHDGAMKGIEEFQKGPGKEAQKRAYRQGYEDCSEDVEKIMSGKNLA